MQGFNMGRYYPPSISDAPTFNQPSNRKKPQNQTVRFELPFAIWCTTCKPHSIIGQGVRFNAEKKRVGSYHSTPIWAFRFKHTACGGWIEIRTDPKNTEYVVHEGGQRRDYGPDDKLGGEGFGKFGGEILTEEERERRRNDAFAALEGKVTDKKTADTEAKRVEGLLKAQDRDWSDPYASSQRIRRAFRAERKIRVRKELEAEGIKDRLGLSIELLDENSDDAKRAALIEYGALSQGQPETLGSLSKPLFGRDSFKDNQNSSRDATTKLSTIGRTKAEAQAEKARLKLQEELKGNTRSALDPFLLTNTTNHLTPGRLNLGIKRKVPESMSEREEKQQTPKSDAVTEVTPTLSQNLWNTMALVDYDSD